MSDCTQETPAWWRAGISLVAIATLIAGTWIGCSKQPVRLVSPVAEADVQEFPLLSASSGVAGLKAAAEIERDAKELAITRVEPVGGQEWKGAITVVFNHPMTAPSFGAKIDDAPFTLAPAVEGQFVWWGERTLVFKPNAPLPPATEFTVTVPKGTTSLDGKKLPEEYTFGFETPGLKVNDVRAKPNRGEIGPGTTFTVDFNLPVKLDDVRANIQLIPDRGEAIGLEIVPVSS
ncbi:MAG: Ig-like domain-containing protein, partial [Myxococcota bacterium]